MSAALFFLYLTYCPPEVVKPNSTCHTEFRGRCEFDDCMETARRDKGLHLPGKRLISVHAREDRKQ